MQGYIFFSQRCKNVIGNKIKFMHSVPFSNYVKLLYKMTYISLFRAASVRNSDPCDKQLANYTCVKFEMQSETSIDVHVKYLLFLSHFAQN
jgi:hypothetical protein